MISVWLSFVMLFASCLMSQAVYNESECTAMHEPKLLRACCKIPHTDEIIATCRQQLLTVAPNEPAEMAVMRNDPVGFHMCIADCEFKRKGYLDGNKELNMKMIEADLRIRHPKHLGYVQLLVEGMQNCWKHARQQTEMLAWTNTHAHCNPFPGIVLACATAEVYENCPASKWKDTKECKQMREFLIKCDKLKSTN